MAYEIVHQREQHRFVVEVDGRSAFLRYRPVDERTLDFTTTWVDPALRGRGVGEALVEAALEYARERGCGVIPTCWFVRTVVDRNPEYGDLLDG